MVLLSIGIVAATPAVSCAVTGAAAPRDASTTSAAVAAAEASAVGPAAAQRQKPATGATPATPVTPATPAAPPPPAQKQLAVDFKLQITPYYCAPAATRMALSARGVHLTQPQLAARLHTTVNGTDSAYDTTRVLNSALNTTFYRTRSIPGQSATPAEMDRLQADAVHAISNGYAIVANIVGRAVDQRGVSHEFMGGHYIAIVGYGDQGRTVKIADSSGKGPSIYWMSTIHAANWIASRGYSA